MDIAKYKAAVYMPVVRRQSMILLHFLSIRSLYTVLILGTRQENDTRHFPG